MNSLSIPRIHYKFTVCFGNSLWILYLFRENTLNSLSVSGIHYEFSIFFVNSPRIHFFYANSLSIWRIHYEFTIFCVNSLWIHLAFSRTRMNLLFFRELAIYLAKILCIYYLIDHDTMNFLSFSRIYHVFMLFMADSVRIHSIFCEFTKCLTKCFANIPRINFLFREFIVYFANFTCYVMIT